MNKSFNQLFPVTNNRLSTLYYEHVVRLNQTVQSFLQVNNLKQEYLLYYIPSTAEDDILAFHISRYRIYHRITIEYIIHSFIKFPYPPDQEIISFEKNQEVIESLDNLDKILKILSQEGTHYTFALIPRLDLLEREPIYTATALTESWERRKKELNDEATPIDFYLWSIFNRFPAKFSYN